jgi:site-specific DNA recombinase
MKAIIIARVSTEEQREAGNSLPAQQARLEKYCQNKGFQVIKRCSFDESAYKGQRDEFDAIIDYVLALKEKIAVCCDKVDRLSRNIFDKRVAQLYENALDDKLELHFVSDGQVLNSRISAVEKFQFGISLGLAKYYSDAISDNVKRSQEQKIRKGEWLAKAPYGYKNIRLANDNTDIVVDEHAAHIVKKTFELYATGAYSMELLCKKLKEDFGVAWPKGYLGKLLNNPFYHGQMIIKGKTHPHRYPPIISRSLFDQVQSIKDGFCKKPVKYAGLAYMYRGLLRCGECGCSITPERHKGFIYYHCTQYKYKHGAKWLREEEITQQLSQVFKSMQVPQDILQEITSTLNKVHEDKMKFHDQHVDALTAEQKTLTKMLDNLYLVPVLFNFEGLRVPTAFV